MNNIKTTNGIVRADVVVNNLPSYALRAYTVVRVVDSNLWFYGSYDVRERALEVAIELGNGIVLGDAEITFMEHRGD